MSPGSPLRNLRRMLFSKSLSVCGSCNIATGLTRTGLSSQHLCRQKLRPEMKRLQPVHSRMSLFIFVFRSDMKLSTFTSALFAALFTILVLNQYILSRLHSSVDVGFQVASEVSHLIRAWRRHNCCFDVRSDSKRSALKICSKNLNGMLVYGRQLGKLKHG